VGLISGGYCSDIPAMLDSVKFEQMQCQRNILLVYMKETGMLGTFLSFWIKMKTFMWTL